MRGAAKRNREVRKVLMHPAWYRNGTQKQKCPAVRSGAPTSTGGTLRMRSWARLPALGTLLGGRRQLRRRWWWLPVAPGGQRAEGAPVVVFAKSRLPLFIRVQPMRAAAQLCARSRSFPCFLLPAPAPHWQRSLREARHTRRGTCMGGVAAHSRTSGPPLAACRSSHDSPPPGSAGLVGVEAGQGWAGQRAGRGCLLAA